jgi:hypothetical protein
MRWLWGIFGLAPAVIAAVRWLGKPPRCMACGGETQFVPRSVGSVRCEECREVRDLAWDPRRDVRYPSGGERRGTSDDHVLPGVRHSPSASSQ